MRSIYLRWIGLSTSGYHLSGAKASLNSLRRVHKTILAIIFQYPFHFWPISILWHLFKVTCTSPCPAVTRSILGASQLLHMIPESISDVSILHIYYMLLCTIHYLLKADLLLSSFYIFYLYCAYLTLSSSLSVSNILARYPQ